ncbi:hypothetical protein N7474_003151 [Penicillium riverlandense]|uniref:uncharacterized protein n=1 Tax=Penicillium riverlandense TaxID=1903569 RepID=UPI0025477047|nr:uncharacterized protein N7474_003151 [Penicillium riverlandense]KAJ5826013.1 hypothetical protein N7474_003151 [Penicillium riverlandense]
MKYGRRHSHPDDRAAVAVRGDGHHHHLDRSKLSHGARDVNYSEAMNEAYNKLARHAWPVFKHDQAPLSSVSTDRETLMSASTTVNNDHPLSSFTDRYARCLEIIHYGTNSTVRLHERRASPGSQSRQLLAIKVYRHSIVSSNSVSNNNTATITSPSSLNDAHPNHPNILPILDLLQNERGELCLVMPYCAGGDLRTLLSRNNPLPTTDTDCIVAQVLRALAFLHEHDIAHRDIRLETVLLTTHGAVKLAGFGDGHIRRLWAECAVPTAEPKDHPPHPHTSGSAPWSFSLPWHFSPFYRATPNSNSNSSKLLAWISNTSTASIPGLSLPYIPPEAFNNRHHKSHHTPFHRKSSSPSSSGEDDEQRPRPPPDPRPADVWATAMIYMTLITGRLLWHSARPRGEDGRYLEYIRCRGDEDGYSPIEALGRRRRNAIYAMLHPNPRKRITAQAMLRSQWMDGVAVCEAGERGY